MLCSSSIVFLYYLCFTNFEKRSNFQNVFFFFLNLAMNSTIQLKRKLDLVSILPKLKIFKSKKKINFQNKILSQKKYKNNNSNKGKSQKYNI